MAAPQTLQFSLRTLILLTIVIAAVVAIGRDVYYLAIAPEGAAHRWSFGPMVGWLALTGLTWRKDWGDLMFVRSLLPGLTIAILAIVAVGSLAEDPDSGFSDQFPVVAYWSLYLTCLVGECFGLCYGLWLLLIGALGRQPPQR